MTAAAWAPDLPKIGVEEEFQLVDSDSGTLVSRADDLLASLTSLPPEVGAIVGELPLSQIETVTPICGSLNEVRGRLRDLRARAAAAAEQIGCRIVAAGTPPLAVVGDQRVSPDPRYRPTLEQQGFLVHEQFIAGMHVHVGFDDDEERVAVLDAIRGWLPVLTAASANSPFWLGRDSGFASYRTVHWGRWPVTGSPPRVRTPAGYTAAIDALVAAGAVSDASRVYWDVRLSSRFPTVELRSMDVCLTVDEAVVLTGLVRALAMTAVSGTRAGREPAEPRPEVLRAATWHAARHGLSGTLLNPHDQRPQPAAVVVRDLLSRVRPALDASGDTDVVCAGVERLLREGTGAARQRAAAANGHGARAVVDYVIEQTLA